MNEWAQWGMQQAGNTATGIMGILANRIGANYDRRHQMKTQEQMMGMQLKANKEMLDYQQAKELEMWNNTNYPAQMQQIKKAGLNPALMYGQSGGGGTTTGGSSAGVAAPSAGIIPTTAPMMGLDIADIQLKMAQARNLDADTKNKTDVIPENIQAQTQSLLAGVENTKAKTTLTEVETRIARIDEWIKDTSKGDVTDQIMWTAQKTLNEVNNLWREGLLSAAQFQDKVNILKAELIGKVLQNSLTIAQTKNVKQDTKNKVELNTQITAETNAIIRKGVQDWKRLSIDERRLEIERLLRDRGLDVQEQGQAMEAISEIIGLGLLMGSDKPERKTIGGFKLGDR